MNVCEGRKREGTENCQCPFRGASQKCKMGSMKKRYYPAKEKVDISSPWQMEAAERLRRMWINDKFISGRTLQEMQQCLQQNVFKESLTQGDLQEEMAQKKRLKTAKPLTWKGRNIRQWLFSLWQIFGRAHHPPVWRKDEAEKIQMHVQNEA